MRPPTSGRASPDVRRPEYGRPEGGVRTEDLERELGRLFLPHEIRIEIVTDHADSHERVGRETSLRVRAVEVHELTRAHRVLGDADRAQPLLGRLASLPALAKPRR